MILYFHIALDTHEDNSKVGYTAELLYLNMHDK